jgi:preprotein translocase subunit SecB
MKEAIQSSFNFEGYKILKSVFDRKEGELGKNFQINFVPSGIYSVKEKRFRINLGVIVVNESKLLTIEIEAMAIFRLQGETAPEILKNYFYLNAPAIFFPYIRAYISALTTLSGLTAVTLPTLNLSYLAEELEKHTIRVDD